MLLLSSNYLSYTVSGPVDDGSGNNAMETISTKNFPLCYSQCNATTKVAHHNTIKNYILSHLKYYLNLFINAMMNLTSIFSKVWNVTTSAHHSVHNNCLFKEMASQHQQLCLDLLAPSLTSALGLFFSPRTFSMFVRFRI